MLKLDATTERRVKALLDKGNREKLTPEEQVELESLGAEVEFLTLSNAESAAPRDDGKQQNSKPAGLIGRLAVDTRFQGQGLGGALVVDAIGRATQSHPLAVFALVVDAKDEGAVRFYGHLGFRPFASRPMSLFLPIVEAARRLHTG